MTNKCFLFVENILYGDNIELGQGRFRCEYSCTNNNYFTKIMVTNNLFVHYRKTLLIRRVLTKQNI